jgi:transcriptional regulator with XRE-family HTH domain
VPAGQQLKSLRNKRNITVREVEHASRRIAEAKGDDKRFCISNGWLAQLENGVSEPSICKLFSLSVIYQEDFLELVRLYNVDVDDKEKYQPVANPQLTQVQTTCGSNGNSAPGIMHAHLSSEDLTMYPMIRPGALLTIDTNQNKLTSIAWRNEYERPIFFIELRNSYACGWCELQGNQLLILPHHSSPASVRRFTYPREAEIAGRVVGYNTPCVDLEAVQQRKLAQVRKTSR